MGGEGAFRGGHRYRGWFQEHIAGRFIAPMSFTVATARCTMRQISKTCFDRFANAHRWNSDPSVPQPIFCWQRSAGSISSNLPYQASTLDSRLIPTLNISLASQDLPFPVLYAILRLYTCQRSFLNITFSLWEMTGLRACVQK